MTEDMVMTEMGQMIGWAITVAISGWIVGGAILGFIWFVAMLEKKAKKN